MYKKTGAVLCAAAGAAMIFSLTACSQGAASAPASSDFTESAAANSSVSAAPAAKTPKNGPIHQIGNEGGTNMYASGENGYYIVVPIFPNSYSILYTDFAANKQVFLCSDPGCDHKGDYCTSYVDASQGNIPGMLFSDDKLYVVSPASVSDAFLPRVEVMDANGSNRKLLAEFKASQNLSTGWFLADHANFYFVMEDISENGNSSKTLCSLDKQSGQVQTIKSLTNDQWILDSDGCDIYLKTIDGLKHSISLLDMETGTVTKDLDQWSQSERSGNMLDGKMYYYDVASNTFVQKDYATGEVASVENTTGFSFTLIYPETILDGKLIFSSVVGQNDAEKHCLDFCVDFEQGEIRELDVMRQDRSRPVNICAVYGDQVYALYGSASKTATFDLNGQINTTTYSTDLIGHESVQDFLSGKSNFVPCETLE